MRLNPEKLGFDTEAQLLAEERPRHYGYGRADQGKDRTGRYPQSVFFYRNQEMPGKREELPMAKLLPIMAFTMKLSYAYHPETPHPFLEKK